MGAEKNIPRGRHRSEDRERTYRGQQENNITNNNNVQVAYYNQLRDAISDERLKPYRRNNNRTDTEVFELYAWNMALSQSMYPMLNGLEVTLRNRIHDTATVEFDHSHWFFVRLLPNEQRSLEKVAERLGDPQRKKPAGDYVASLSFGFWASLFNERYGHGLWRKFHESVFPYAPKRQRTAKELLRRLENIRRFRNRVFHHEPIWNQDNLPDQHRLIMETIGWINPAMLKFLEVLDQFPETYAAGSGYYQQKLATVSMRQS